MLCIDISKREGKWAGLPITSCSLNAYMVNRTTNVSACLDCIALNCLASNRQNSWSRSSQFHQLLDRALFARSFVPRLPDQLGRSCVLCEEGTRLAQLRHSRSVCCLPCRGISSGASLFTSRWNCGLCHKLSPAKPALWQTGYRACRGDSAHSSECLHSCSMVSTSQPALSTSQSSPSLRCDRLLLRNLLGSCLVCVLDTCLLVAVLSKFFSTSSPLLLEMVHRFFCKCACCWRGSSSMILATFPVVGCDLVLRVACFVSCTSSAHSLHVLLVAGLLFWFPTVPARTSIATCLRSSCASAPLSRAPLSFC